MECETKSTTEETSEETSENTSEETSEKTCTIANNEMNMVIERLKQEHASELKEKDFKIKQLEQQLTHQTDVNNCHNKINDVETRMNNKINVANSSMNELIKYLAQGLEEAKKSIKTKASQSLVDKLQNKVNSAQVNNQTSVENNAEDNSDLESIVSITDNILSINNILTGHHVRIRTISFNQS